MQKYIPYGMQDISEADINAVVEVLRSDLLTQGPVVPAFEQAVAKKVGAEHALAVNSATSALHIACLALGLGQGDWRWTTPTTFVAWWFDHHYIQRADRIVCRWRRIRLRQQHILHHREQYRHSHGRRCVHCQRDCPVRQRDPYGDH